MPGDNDSFDFTGSSSSGDSTFIYMGGSSGDSGGSGANITLRGILITASVVAATIFGGLSLHALRDKNQKATSMDLCLAGENPTPSFGRLFGYQFNSVPGSKRDVNIVDNRVVVTEVIGTREYNFGSEKGVRYFTDTYAITMGNKSSDTYTHGHIDSYNGQNKISVDTPLTIGPAAPSVPSRYQAVKECTERLGL